MRTTTRVALAAALAGLSTAAAAIDCSRAATGVEHRVCADAEVLSLDRQLSVAYAGLEAAGTPAEAAALKAGQRRWLQDDRNRCGDDDCLVRAYGARLQALREPLARDPKSPPAGRPARRVAAHACAGGARVRGDPRPGQPGPPARARAQAGRRRQRARQAGCRRRPGAGVGSPAVVHAGHRRRRRAGAGGSLHLVRRRRLRPGRHVDGSRRRPGIACRRRRAAEGRRRRQETLLQLHRIGGRAYVLKTPRLDTAHEELLTLRDGIVQRACSLRRQGDWRVRKMLF